MELLAPAGSWNAFIAAVQNGADAVYVGGQNFSARQYAQNFAMQQIKEAADYAHIRDRKIYVTVNTLIDYEEFGPALDYIYELHILGVDAVIVQDLGLVKAIQKTIPGMKIHASTQMTIHNSYGALFLREQGIKRIVLARETSLRELEFICKELSDVEFEVFIHGALCYSYSGQCLFSSMVGGRSGNRGRCAQPCRLPYDLYSQISKQRIDVKGRGQHLLSPSDLALLENLPLLKKAGVSSLKIEGRMKRPEYVAIVTRTYREALDLFAQNPAYIISPEAKNDLRKIFNRNFSTGYLFEERNNFLSSKKPNNQGVYIGRVVDQTQDLMANIQLSDTVKPGDYLEIWIKQGKGPVIELKEIITNGKKVDSAGRGEVITVQLETRVASDDKVFKIHDEELLSTEANNMHLDTASRVGITVDAYLKQDTPLRLVFTDEKGNQVEVLSNSKAQLAEKYPLDKHSLKGKIDRLGNTPFRLDGLSLYTEGDLMIPFSEINDARRRGCEQLEQLLLQPYQPAFTDKGKYQQLKKDMLGSKGYRQNREVTPVISIIVSGIEPAYAAMKSGAQRVYIALEGISKNGCVHIDELETLIELAHKNNCEIVPALPRIQKDAEIHDWDKLLNINIDSIMAGNHGALKWCLNRGLKTRADYSLNVFNPVTLDYLLEIGVKSICLSPELNFTQLKKFHNMDKAEVVIHGELVIMVSQFCMLSGMLGDPRKKCPGHCIKDRYFIKDEKGYEFPVETDSYCRFYLFNSRTLCMLSYLQQLLSLKAGSLRIEARRSNEQEITQVIKIYRQVLEQLKNGQKPDLDCSKKELARVSSSAFTKGHFYRGVL
ncbi:MAG: DUF3656 domain-containing protein [Syntrophomonadaceae bacterium]|nr:DUF3656 domain-containing protein [Syntrophomonadaceae bacterium]